jgi:hypothetical protein
MIKKAPIISLLCAIIYVISLKIIVVSGMTRIQIPMISTLVSVSIIAIPLYIGLLYIRKNCYNNSMNFAQAFYSGIVISILSACFIFGILALLEINNILIPDLIADNKLSAAAYIKNFHPTPEEITEIHKNTINSTLPYAFSKVHFAIVLLISGFSSTILSLFVRNKDTFTEINK